MDELIEKFEAAKKRGEAWILNLMNADGSFKGSEHLVFGVFKAPLVLNLLGHQSKALLATDYIGKQFFKEGDFNSGHGDPSPLLDCNYRNAWLIWGSHTVGRTDLSESGADYLLSSAHPKLGGIPSRKEYHPKNNILDWGTTALSIIAFTAVGRMEAAIACGAFIDHLIAIQPDPDDQLYMRMGWDGKLITHFQPGTEGTSVIKFNTPNQLYWYFGAAMAGFAALYRVTEDRRWLESAEKVFQLSEKCRPWVYQDLTSGKVCWANTWLYQLTGDDRHKEAMLAAGEYTLSIQEPVGAWVRRSVVPLLELQPSFVGLEVTLERTAWCHYIVDALTKDEINWLV